MLRLPRLPSQRLATLSPRALAFAVLLLIFGSTLIALELLYRQTVRHQGKVFRLQLSHLVAVAANRVDLTKHEALTRPDQQHSELYRQTLAPLVDFHLTNPGAIYVYTVRFTADGQEVFVLDTANDPRVRRLQDRLGRRLIPSALLEPYTSPESEYSKRMAALRSGQRFVFFSPYEDDYGTFLGAVAPLHDSTGRLVGYTGIDFTLDETKYRLSELRTANRVAIVIALLLAGALARLTYSLRTRTLRNVARAQYAEQSAREQRDLARKAGQEKSAVLALATHDLKHPLGIITDSAAHLIAHKRAAPDPATVQDDLSILETIHDSAQHMSEVVRRILAQEGLADVDETPPLLPVDLTDLVNDVLASNRSAARRKAITLVENIAADQHTTGDPIRLREAFDNYVSNAIKYSPAERSITVCLEPLPDGAGHRFSVHDQGPGLTAEDQAKLFGKFQTLSAQPTAGESATGLGLSIVKTVIEKHGGTVGCDSVPGAGACFWLNLPRPPTPDP